MVFGKADVKRRLAWGKCFCLVCTCRCCLSGPPGLVTELLFAQFAFRLCLSVDLKIMLVTILYSTFEAKPLQSKTKLMAKNYSSHITNVLGPSSDLYPKLSNVFMHHLVPPYANRLPQPHSSTQLAPLQLLLLATSN
jgi:hypothetical protein